MLKTMYIERNPPSADLDDESRVYSHLRRQDCVRLHFFAANIVELKQISTNVGTYRGYCDIRSDGTIARCNISGDVIVRADTYGYLVCQTSEAIRLVTGDKVSVTGFSHVEKNRRGLMCSQAALANVVHYWNARQANTFSRQTAVDITKGAGISEDKLRSGDFKGLTHIDVNAFLKEQGFNCFMAVVKREEKKADELDPLSKKSTLAEPEPPQSVEYGTFIAIKEEHAGVTIYGFLESGFPVIAVVQTKSEDLHALTVVGHTFDKNIWLAFADRFYYDQPLTSGYHSNLDWIRFFIVQDDNLGPYFFVPRANIAPVIKYVIVPLPYPNVKISPKGAEEAAYDALAQWLHRINERNLPGANVNWLTLLKSHFEPKDKGWVLRPYLRLKEQVAQLFAKHEFAPAVTKSLDANPGTVFWVVELSWPNLYCYDGCKAGEIVIDATNGTLALIHLPGVMMLGPIPPEVVFATGEDPPRRCFPNPPNEQR